MKTIKQIADTLEVDKQRVYRYIRRNRISEAHHEAGVMWYDEAAERLIIQHFSKSDCIRDVHHEAHHTTSNDTVIDTVVVMLQRELDIKNEQIRELNARLAESNAALVAAQQSAQAAQFLHAGTMQKQLTDAGADQAEPDAPAKNLLARIFRKK